MSGDLLIVGLGWLTIAVIALIVRLAVRFTMRPAADVNDLLLYCVQRLFGALLVYALLAVAAVLICRFTPGLAPCA